MPYKEIVDMSHPVPVEQNRITRYKPFPYLRGMINLALRTADTLMGKRDSGRRTTNSMPDNYSKRRHLNDIETFTQVSSYILQIAVAMTSRCSVTVDLNAEASPHVSDDNKQTHFVSYKYNYVVDSDENFIIYPCLIVTEPAETISSDDSTSTSIATIIDNAISGGEYQTQVLGEIIPNPIVSNGSTHYIAQFSSDLTPFINKVVWDMEAAKRSSDSIPKTYLVWIAIARPENQLNISFLKQKLYYSKSNW